MAFPRLSYQSISNYFPETVTVWNTVCVLITLQIARYVYIRLTYISISHLPGPPKTDWLFGNLSDIYFGEVGVPQLAWQKKFGKTFKLYGLAGDNYIMTSDWKAIQHIYANSNIYMRQTQNRELFRMMTGPGLAVAHGEDHKRQRRVMQPAFGIPQIKGLFPVFSFHTANLVSVMKRDMDAGNLQQKTRMNVHDYSVKVTLDTIGDATFEHQFGALDNRQDALKEAIHTLEKTLASPTKLTLFLQFVMDRIPTGLFQYLPYLPLKKFVVLRAVDKEVTSIAKELITTKMAAYEQGLEGGKDLMSLLIRANANEDARSKLSEEEVKAEIATLIFAGYGTSANTLAFALWELAKDLDLQSRMRDEIRQTARLVERQGGTEIEFSEYDSMDLLVAFIKEVLRFYPVAFNATRQALDDDIIPLTSPVTLDDGTSVTEIPISKGQKLFVNMQGYNKLPELFGEDSDTFNVGRWLDPEHLVNDKKKPGVGVYANLITFAHGPRACIGWRLTLWQLQMQLIHLLSAFEFSVPEGASDVFKMAAVTMVPTVKGHVDGGSALYLDVSLIN